MSEKQLILIIDDSELNRDMLTDMLNDGYEIIEAADGKNGIEQIKENKSRMSLILLDLVMPGVDGFGVLEFLKKEELTDDIPVIIISSDNTTSGMQRAFDLGAADYITRPFDMCIVRKRVQNTIMLYERQKMLVRLVSEQIYEREKNNQMMINILSHIVEFRNGESGQHVLHIRRFTDILLASLLEKTDRYHITNSDAVLISNASALHDIGKISVPDAILNKPGRFTSEEFEVMKTHSVAGADMISDIASSSDNPLIRQAYTICRWHHERYDGKGYPDGLSGDEIPISAQVISIADVYDALTSERVYKEAYSHEKAMDMIMNGECGQFNPLLLDCLKECSEKIRNALSEQTDEDSMLMKGALHITEEMLRNRNIGIHVS